MARYPEALPHPGHCLSTVLAILAFSLTPFATAYSNADIEKPNDGIDLHQIVLGAHF